ncbi:Uncharacterised protein [Sphingobacterium multivorum]|uniref:Lipocalin-like domain-containing protein n=1 Tax=Sphingobacterium multivorum TaxID=28454 RepID=A0A654DIV2_SPHMU|nr:Uncharacterised protein [Sphingobacterium multivorum]VXD04378.1 conserved exported hypothetical protein [Sphingobacterium multivorum]
MKNIFAFFASLLFACPLFAQSNKLLGKWVLDFALTEENSLVPVDNPYFSNEVIYEISLNKMKISAYMFDAKYIGDNASIPPMEGIQLSIKIKSGFVSVTFSITSWEVEDTATEYPKLSNIIEIISSNCLSSSNNNIFFFSILKIFRSAE